MGISSINKICSWFKQKWKALIIIIIFLLPFLCSWYLFFYTDITFKVKSERTSDEKVLITILKSDVKYQAFQDVIAQVLRIPLNLNHYKICLKNRSSKEERGEKEFIPLKEVTLTKDTGEDSGIGVFDMLDDRLVCKNINLDKVIIASSSYSFNFKYLPSRVTVNIDIAPDEIASLALIDRWISAIIFSIGFYGFLLLAKSVIYVIWSQIKILKQK